MHGTLTDFNISIISLFSKLINTIKYIGIAAVLSFSLVACGQKNETLPESPELTGIISGVAFIGPVESGDVTVYEFDGKDRGAALGSSRVVILNSEGTYSISLTTPNKPILVCLSGDVTYREMTKLEIVNFKPDQELCAIENYESGSEFMVTLTYYSHIASGLATRLVSLGIKPDDAVTKANQELREWVGYNINKTIPIDLSIPLNPIPGTIQGKHRAGFANAAISVYSGWVNGISGIGPSSTERLQNFNSILFAQRAYRDIVADGILDGKSGSGPTGLGAVPLSTKTYRRDVALDMLVMANHKNNKSGINLKSLVFRDALFADAARFSQFDLPTGDVTSRSTFNIFGQEAAIAPLQSVKPTMNNFIIPKVVVNDPAIGGVKIAASVTDIINQLTSVEYNIINTTTAVSTPFETFTNPDANGLTVDLSRTVATLKNPDTGTPAAPNFLYPDGSNYAIKIVASYTIIDSVTGTAAGTGTVATPEKPLTMGNIGTQIKGLNPRSSTATVKSYVSGTFNMFSGISNPLGITNVALTIDGIDATAVSNFSSGKAYNVPIFRIDTTPYSDGPHEFVITASGASTNANQTANVTGSYFIDNTAPIISTTPPPTPASSWFNTDFNIVIAASDAGSGLDNYKILIDGLVAETIPAPAPRPNNTAINDTRPILVNTLTDGAHTIIVEARDEVGLTSRGASPILVKTDATAPILNVTPTSQAVTYTLPTSTCMLNTILAQDTASGVAKIEIDSVPATTALVFAAPVGPINASLQSFIPAAVPATVTIALKTTDNAGNVSGLTRFTVAVAAVTTVPVIANKFTCTIAPAP